MNSLNNVLEEKKCVLERVQGLDMQGRPLFAYVLLKKNRLNKFKKALAERDVDLAEFGVIIGYGNSEEPPAGFEQTVLDALEAK